MEIKEWLSVISLALSLFAIMYSLITNTKRYELKTAHRKEILNWYNATNEVLIDLKINVASKNLSKENKINLLSKLSSKIDLGRFYFPNIDKGDNYGKEKPQAYKGYRNLILDLLVFSYRLFERDDSNNYLKHAEILQRYFTSFVFEILNPQKHIEETKKYTKMLFTKEITFEDFIYKEPEILQEYL
jgi:hypothetical protein